MEKWVRWVFRVLASLFIIYHLWSISLYGYDAFTVIKPDFTGSASFSSRVLILMLYLIGNLFNYVVQLILPLIFFYFGFVYKDNSSSFKTVNTLDSSSTEQVAPSMQVGGQESTFKYGP